MNLLDELTSGLTLTVESRISPPLSIDLGTGGAPQRPNPLMSFARPKVTLSKGDLVLATETPYGDPNETANVFPLVMMGAVVLLIAAVLFLVR